VVTEAAANHRRAAARHDAAANNHDRAAQYWHDQTDPKRAELQHEMAEFERRGAELERRWAKLVDDDPRNSTAGAGDAVRDHTRQGAQHLSGILGRIADTLERSAHLAEEHAQRREDSGATAGAEEERAAAKQAHDAADRARTQAEDWARIFLHRQ
jgi:hypothetical protein